MKRKKKLNERPKPDRQNFVLRLYVTGITTQSRRALTNIKKLCDQYLPDRYELEVVDIYRRPELAKTQQIIAAPTLIKQLPEPVRKFIGDMSNTSRILSGLEIVPAPVRA